MSTPTPPDPCGPAQLLGLLERLAAQLQQLEQAAAGLALGDQQAQGPSVGSIVAGHSRLGPTLRAETETLIRERFIAGFQRVLDSAARGYGGKV